MSTYVFKAIDLAGVKAKGEVEADSKQAVSDQLKSRGLIVLDIADKHSSREINLTFFESVNATELAVFARQLATMISSGMSILRALYVLEEQTESKLLEGDDRRGPQGRRGGAVAERRDGAPSEGVQHAVRGDDAGGRGRRCARGLRCCASPTSSRRTPRCKRQIKSAMIYPILVVVVRGRDHARAVRLPDPRVHQRLQGIRRRTAGDHEGLGVRVRTS